jgi:hypothetical protein
MYLYSMERYFFDSRRSPYGFDLRDAGDQRVASLNEIGWLRRDAEGSIGTEPFRLVREGFWGRSYRVLRSDVQVATISFSSFGRITIQLHNAQGAPSQLFFTRKSFWEHRYVIRLGKGLDLLEFRSTFNWRKLAHDHSATVVGPGLSPEQLRLVLVLGGYCMRLVGRRRAAVAAAT